MDIVPAIEARKLLRAARAGVLATQQDGQPFAGLVTPATDADGSVLLLLSDLSEHTRQLRADGRCAVMVSGAATEANPQTAPRLTLRGRAEITPDAACRARWLAAHPYAAFYADFTDFNLWRIELSDAAYVGGFARAFKLDAEDLAPDAAAIAAVAAASPGIMTHCNADHADTLALLAGGGSGWTMAAVDVDGCDLSDGTVSRRIAWPASVADPLGVRAALIALARTARL